MLERLTDKELRELETSEHGALQPYMFIQSVHPHFAAGEVHGLTAGIAARLGASTVTIQAKNVVEKSTVFGWQYTSGAGGTVDEVAQAQGTANAASIAALNASQAAQDALITAGPTQAQVDDLQAVQDAEDPYRDFTRQPDGSIDWERESGATGTIAAPSTSSTVLALNDDGSVDPAVTAEVGVYKSTGAVVTRTNGGAWGQS